MKPRIHRRRFLHLAAGTVAAPLLWIPRVSRGATPAFGSVRHLLILFARGGFRSHATFNAAGTIQHCPFGTQETAPGTEWTLGSACGRESYSTSLGDIPAFAEVTNDVTVVGCVDHVPGEPVPVIDHIPATRILATGSRDGASGLLTWIGAHHLGTGSVELPPVEIVRSDFGLAGGDLAKGRSLATHGAARPLVSSAHLGQGRGIAARRLLDDAFAANRPDAYANRVSRYLSAKEHGYTLAPRLAHPALSVLDRPDAELGGVTNAALREVLGDEAPDFVDPERVYGAWGLDVALALRFLQLGSPACVVTRRGFDLHDRERTEYGPLTVDLVRQLAGLHFVLPRLEHPSGGTYWDHTLVAVVSEFSRNNTLPGGFNSGAGSDHVLVSNAPQRNQAIALMGGPITRKGALLAPTDAEMRPLGPVYSSRSLLATFLDVVGIESHRHTPDPPIGELFT